MCKFNANKFRSQQLRKKINKTPHFFMKIHFNGGCAIDFL